MRFSEHTINNAEERKFVTQKRVKELLIYHKEGYLTWRTKHVGRKQGGVAGSLKQNGYMQIKIDGRVYYLHRIIYLWHYGIFPDIIDHIDRDKLNNRIENLRNTTQTINRINSDLSKRNKTNVTGVSHTSDGYWIAQIGVNYNIIKIGYFKKFDDAVLARWKFEVKYNFINCNSTSSAYLYLKENKILPALKIRRIIH